MKAGRIMFVEDERVVALMLQTMLEYLGYEVCGHTELGEEALDLYERLKPDLVIFDVLLAGDMDGIEAAEGVRRASAVPIVFSTAYTDEDVFERMRRLEPQAVLVKPLELEVLQRVLEQALPRERPPLAHYG